MSKIENLQNWSWDHKKCVFISSLITAIIITLIIWCITTDYKWASIASVLSLVLPNFLQILQWGKEVSKVMKLGWREVELNQKERDYRVNRLLELDKLQFSNVDSYFKTSVDSVNYGEIATTAPNIMMEVSFFNLLVVPIRITQCKLHIERIDSCEVNCKGKACRLKPHDITIDDHDKEIEATKFRPIRLRIDIPDCSSDSVAEAIKGCFISSGKIRYTLRIHWELQLNNKEPHEFRDYLDYEETPLLDNELRRLLNATA